MTSLVTLRVGVNDMLVACAGPRGKREIYIYLEILEFIGKPVESR